MSEQNIYRQQRIQKGETLRDAGVQIYANKYKPEHLATEFLKKYSEFEKEQLEDVSDTFKMAGRVIAIRNFGKAGFYKLRDRSGEFQIYVQRGLMGGDEGDLVRKNAEVGDFLYVEGKPFKTKTGELTVEVTLLRFVTKSIEQLPEKYHGLTDVEARYRQRYVDLIANPEVKDVFRIRSKMVSFIRRYLEEKDFLEVETPMMQAIPGGAAARPFVTHHNALDMDLYLRIAPELYLKRLVVGGIERVFEINRNFRNEGISTQHNPEFTMLEFYQAYATYEDLIELTEDLLAKLAVELKGSETVIYQEKEISFKKPFARYTLAESLSKFVEGITPEIVHDKDKLIAACEARQLHVKNKDTVALGQVQILMFEELVEAKLMQPTFITHYPTVVSPLSRKNDEDPTVTDRFEFFIYGRELANAFSELNDPIDQKERFLKQVAERESGDDEAMYMDEDYVKALEYGMPPAAGEGIGIDRLAMIFTDSPSIRDVILFPTLRRVDS